MSIYNWNYSQNISITNFLDHFLVRNNGGLISLYALMPN